jgi:hypothetical protein
MNSRGNRHTNNATRGGSSRNNNSARPMALNSHPQTQAHTQIQGPALSPKDQADLDSFRAALKELTFNSRPIIEKLTAMARDRARTIPGPVSRTILDNLVFVNNKLT